MAGAKAIASALVFVAGLVLVGAQTASAMQVVPVTGSPGLLSMWGDTDDLDLGYVPTGSTTYRQVVVALDNAASAELALQLVSSGALVEHIDGVTLSAAMCDTRWVGMPTDSRSRIAPHCASNEIRVLSAAAGTPLPEGGRFWQIGGIRTERQRFMLITAVVPVGDREAVGRLWADFAIQVTAEGDTPAPATPGESISGHNTVPPPGIVGRLANTGLNLLSIVLLGVGGIGLGSALAAAARSTESGSTDGRS
jgi:hypothetical protein